MDLLLTHLPLAWAIFSALMIVMEVMVPHFGCLFPGIAAMAAFGASFVTAPAIQFLIFSVVLILGVVFLRPWFQKKNHKSVGVPARAHSLIGKHGIVTVVTTKELGRVMVEGQDWAMHSEDKLKIGDEVKVKTVDGIVLIVKK